MLTIASSPLLTPLNYLVDDIEQDGIADAKRIIWLETQNAFDPEIGVIGPDLYTGMAGMAITYLNAYRVGGRRHHRKIAKHCLHYALDHADDIAPEHRPGFYNGWAGLLYAAVYGHSVLWDEVLRARAEDLLQRLAALPVGQEYDLMTGAAGTVLATALVAPVLGEPAKRVGLSAAEGLHEAAIRHPDSGAVSWKTAGDQLPLTGLSHGNAGIGWALCELHAATDETWLEELAGQAFRYERQYFDTDAGNWYDLRHYASADTLRHTPPPCETAWCHGAGGIALSRLRAYEITGDRDYLSELTVAARTLSSAVAGEHPERELPSCLCHGLVGNLDILLTLRRRALPELSFLEDTPRYEPDLVAFATDRRRRSIDPGLFLGLGGMAHYLMRLANPGIPPVLLPAL
ncbi:lantibiotic modifying enzyme [Lewinella marina]|uniref:Lanthionine synthetase n=1 Tax=Neolewinella marina TaxID=438751 RepID=A0A2G0CEB3_9BACT|nr:lanthionine synthetase LanC family protein [Neolewinella marina]NJB87372.1 lantibiotic modifying enzyme [Neolewinella marina]PHK98314.1 hypothetical protein CGL56_11470 [Neolewinella marina]